MTEEAVQFETPENIVVSYPLAGPGTRYVAFVLDMLIILFAGVVIGLIALGIVFVLMSQQGPAAEAIGNAAAAVVVGIAVAAAFSLTIAYFLAAEFWMNGQTVGKRAIRIRAVMEKGYSLTFPALFLRNIFRVIDSIPVFWVVPVFTQRYRRFGDMAAGTVVVSEKPDPEGRVWEYFANRPAAESRYSFQHQQLTQLTQADTRAALLFLGRRNRMGPRHREQLRAQLVSHLCERVGEAPPGDGAEQERFLEDLLGAHARREASELG